jgi:hypothetical protein
MMAGTSASTPVFAAMISLINNERLSNGLSPMGFLNPFLYASQTKQPDAFNDITEGNNACSTMASAAPGCCDHKFHAAKGWDAVTGLGSPKFDKLLKLAMNYKYQSSTLTSKPSSPPSPSLSPSHKTIQNHHSPSFSPTMIHSPSLSPTTSPIIVHNHHSPTRIPAKISPTSVPQTTSNSNRNMKSNLKLCEEMGCKSNCDNIYCLKCILYHDHNTNDGQKKICSFSKIIAVASFCKSIDWPCQEEKYV